MTVGATVGAVKTAAASSRFEDAESLTLPSIGRLEIKVWINPSKTEILSFTIEFVLLLASLACSIIGDEANGRTDVLTWVGRRGGRDDALILNLEFINC